LWPGWRSVGIADERSTEAKEAPMYASTTMFTVSPGMRERMEQLADRMLVGMRQMNGFVSITFVMDDEANEYGGFALWESKDDAEAAMIQTGSKLDEALAGIVIGPLRRKLFEIYESKV
jgi:quinol monooxygenase YgiN